MKFISLFMMIAVAGGLVLPMQAAESDQLKSALVGQCMGGREKCWKFQSADQIKELVIKNKTQDAQKQVYTIALQLQAANVSGISETSLFRTECRAQRQNSPMPLSWSWIL